MKILSLILALPVITVLQAAWVFYIWPSKYGSWLTVTFLPFIIVFASHAYLYQLCLNYYRTRTGPKFAGLLGLSFLSAILSWWISMLPAVNTYGT